MWSRLLFELLASLQVLVRDKLGASFVADEKGLREAAGKKSQWDGLGADRSFPRQLGRPADVLPSFQGQ